MNRLGDQRGMILPWFSSLCVISYAQIERRLRFSISDFIQERKHSAFPFAIVKYLMEHHFHLACIWSSHFMLSICNVTNLDSTKNASISISQMVSPYEGTKFALKTFKFSGCSESESAWFDSESAFYLTLERRLSDWRNLIQNVFLNVSNSQKTFLKFLEIVCCGFFVADIGCSAICQTGEIFVRN